MSRLYDELGPGNRGRASSLGGGWSFEISVYGNTVVQDALRRIAILSRAIDRDTALLSSMEAAARLIQRVGKLNLSERLQWADGTTGSLLRQFRTRRRRNMMAVAAGFNRPEGAHAHLVDLGTGPRYTKSGKYRGVMPANMFWTDAIETTQSEAQDRFLDAVDRAVKRLLIK